MSRVWWFFWCVLVAVAGWLPPSSACARPLDTTATRSLFAPWIDGPLAPRLRQTDVDEPWANEADRPLRETLGDDPGDVDLDTADLLELERTNVDLTGADVTDFLPPLDAPSPLFLPRLDRPWEPAYDDPLLPIEAQPDRAAMPEDYLMADLAYDDDPAEDATPKTWRERLYRRFTGLFDEWASRVSLGGRSLAGNSNQNFVDLLADFENKTKWRATQINLGGQFGESNNKIVANRWFANSTTDYYHGPKWLTFTKVMDQYDALQNLDYRGTFSAGLGYRFLFDDTRRIITRVGPGVTLEVFHDPSDSRVTADAFGELEMRLPIWKRLKWEQKTTLFPSLTSLEVARAQNNTSLFYAFDERERWSLRVGFVYQYISEPNPGKVPSDYTTNVSIMYQRK
jgi:putative salt-induced outer membrane protein YdiY